MSLNDELNPLKRSRIDRDNNNLVEEDALSDSSDEEQQEEQSQDDKSNNNSNNVEQQQQAQQFQLQNGSNEQYIAMQYQSEQQQQQQQQYFIHMALQQSQAAAQGQINNTNQPMINGLPLNIIARITQLPLQQQQMFHFHHQLYLQKLQQLRQAQACNQAVPPQLYQMLQAHQHFLAMLLAGAPFPAQLVNAQQQQLQQMLLHQQQLQQQQLHMQQQQQPLNRSNLPPPMPHQPPHQPITAASTPTPITRPVPVSPRPVKTPASSTPQPTAARPPPQAVPGRLVPHPKPTEQHCDTPIAPRAVSSKIPLPPWLTAEGAKMHSEKQLASQTDLSKTKKKYRMALCIYCAKVYPQSPWATLKSRKYEHEIFRKHEKSNIHQRSLLELNKCALTGGSPTMQVSHSAGDMPDSDDDDDDDEDYEGNGKVHTAPSSTHQHAASSSSQHASVGTAQALLSLNGTRNGVGEGSSSSDPSSGPPAWLRMRSVEDSDTPANSEEKRLMMCTYCAEYVPSSPWAHEESRPYEPSALIAHEVSELHFSAARQYQAAHGSTLPPSQLSSSSSSSGPNNAQHPLTHPNGSADADSPRAHTSSPIIMLRPGMHAHFPLAHQNLADSSYYQHKHSQHQQGDANTHNAESSAHLLRPPEATQTSSSDHDTTQATNSSSNQYASVPQPDNSTDTQAHQDQHHNLNDQRQTLLKASEESVDTTAVNGLNDDDDGEEEEQVDEGDNDDNDDNK